MRYWDRIDLDAIRPRSALAYLFAVVVVGIATAARFVFAYFGATLYFASYYPAILVVALFAGFEAGLLATALTLLSVWWAFISPQYQFGILSVGDYANFILFVISSVLVIMVTTWTRDLIAQLRKSESSYELLSREMNHRGRNTFAVIQAIVHASLRDDKQTANVIVGRVHAVSRTNDLVNTSDGQYVGLRALITCELGPFDTEGRVVLDGSDIELSSDTARNVALALHELTTNAIKYGAMQGNTGSLAIEWTQKDGEVAIQWREKDGPPVIVPTRTGFGSEMIRRSMKAINGTVETVFEPNGLICRLRFPID